LYDTHTVLVHNQCSDFELVSPAYFGRNAIWIRSSDQKVDTNAMTRASFGKEIFKDKFASVLIYKLQRKGRLKSNDQSNVDSAFTEDSSTSFNRTGYSVRALLIKHGNIIDWNEDTLEKLHSMYHALCRDDEIEDTWLLDDATVLMTTSKWKKDSHAFEITISEGIRKDDSMGPLWVSSNM
jgi:hypothetical protein